MKKPSSTPSVKPPAKPKAPGPLRRLAKRVWAAPTPELVDAGLRGEWMVASIRLLIVLLLLYFPLKQSLHSQDPNGRPILLWFAVAALAEALVIYSAVMRSWGRSWIGFFSGILDVSLVSLSLAIFARLGDPLAVTNDVVIFPLYLLAIGATSLRFDWRICVLTGLAASFQYGALAYWAAWQFDLARTVDFSWTQQLGRLMLLVMATALAISLVTRAYEQRSLSNKDRLTQLANRGFFDESLARIAALAARSGDSVTVAMIDVDHFKRFNDTYGHLAGDEALRTVSRVMADSFRTTDLLARYGGEEFAGLFPGMQAASAEGRLDGMRAAIERTPIKVDGRGTEKHVTVSIGAAVWPVDGLNLNETLAIADQRLYQAKLGGRNRVVLTGGKAVRPKGEPQAATPASQASPTAPTAPGTVTPTPTPTPQNEAAIGDRHATV